jgi:hypothetical protein
MDHATTVDRDGLDGMREEIAALERRYRCPSSRLESRFLFAGTPISREDFARWTDLCAVLKAAEERSDARRNP